MAGLSSAVWGPKTSVKMAASCPLSPPLSPPRPLPPLPFAAPHSRALERAGAAVSEALFCIREIAGAARRIQARADSWASAAASARAEVALEKQRQLIAAAARLGLSAMFAAALWASLRYGRIWEVHAICSAAAGSGGRRGRGGWAAAALVPRQARGLASAWGYCMCFIENMGVWRPVRGPRRGARGARRRLCSRGRSSGIAFGPRAPAPGPPAHPSTCALTRPLSPSLATPGPPPPNRHVLPRSPWPLAPQQVCCLWHAPAPRPRCAVAA
jgi:hypothetical protein